MPSFSFHRPRFLRSHRSRSPGSPNTSPTGPSDSDVSRSACPNPPSTPPSLSSSRLASVAELDVNAAAPICHPSAPRNSLGHQSSTGNLRVDEALDLETNTQPSQESRQVSQTSAVHPLRTSHQSLGSDSRMTQPSGQSLPASQHQHHGMFYQAHDFMVTGTFIENNVNINTSSQFMEKLLEKTIPGAEFDSSDRDPPPRCHPGTRLTILKRCLDFIHDCNGEKKVRWVVGAAGVGKSAIMQSVAESPELPVSCHASVFFSVNGRNDGAKAIITLSYQFAVKSDSYRERIEKEIARDPSLLRSSMAKQFLKFIVEPFIHDPHLNSTGRVLIIIDGLDECNDPHTQHELLHLICDFCISYPSSPLVWLIASRPETHIASFFARPGVMLAYEKEEIPVDSEESRADVERFLRQELMEIREASDSLSPQWPEERNFWKLANASGGLFAYAQTMTRYIGDSMIGSPASQLLDVLKVIDNHPLTDVQREDHPMALLDALYARILSTVPTKVMTNTRKLLLALASDWDSVLQRPSWPPSTKANFILLCNWLGMTCDEAYAALNHLRSVLHVPRRDKAHEEKLEPFHKSFLDFISDFSRSGFSSDIQLEARQLGSQCAFRVLKEAPDGINFFDADYATYGGILEHGPGTGDKISLTWPAEDQGGWSDDATRLRAYKLAIGEVIAGMERGDPTFQTMFCVRLLASRFEEYDYDFFPLNEIRDLLFDESRHREFMIHGILKQMPLKAIDISTIFNKVKLQFRRPASTVTNLSDPWNSSCQHKRAGEWDEGKDMDWVTTFWDEDCAFCLERLEHQLDGWNARSPDQTLPTLFTSAGDCCVEFRFIDPLDGMSEWTYWFWFELRWEELEKYEALYHA